MFWGPSLPFGRQPHDNEFKEIVSAEIIKLQNKKNEPKRQLMLADSRNSD